MAQSDYLKYKRVTTELKINGSKLSPVLDAQDYVNYKEYALEKSIVNNKTIYNRITPTGRQPIK
jgi:hypothetical protein